MIQKVASAAAVLLEILSSTCSIGDSENIAQNVGNSFGRSVESRSLGLYLEIRLLRERKAFRIVKA